MIDRISLEGIVRKGPLAITVRRIFSIDSEHGTNERAGARIIPSGKYAHFRHSFKDGGYDEAFAKVERWLQESGADVEDFGLQCFGEDFDPGNVQSEFDIFIPLR